MAKENDEKFDDSEFSDDEFETMNLPEDENDTVEFEESAEAASAEDDVVDTMDLSADDGNEDTVETDEFAEEPAAEANDDELDTLDLTAPDKKSKPKQPKGGATSDFEEFPRKPGAKDSAELAAALADNTRETADLPDDESPSKPQPADAAAKSISDTALTDSDDPAAEDVGATVMDPHLAGSHHPPEDLEPQTIEVDEQGAPATAQSTYLDEDPAPSGATLLDKPDIMQTINTRDLSPEEAEEFQRTLIDDDLASAASIADAMHPADHTELRDSGTVPSEEPAAEANTETQLVIQKRQFREPKSSAPPSTTADYELLELLGEGGMGVVYAATQTSIDRQVAIKMLKAKYVEKKKQRDNFLSEAVVTGDLDHPNIVPIYDVGKNETDALFYSMKRVQGTPWRDVLEEKSVKDNVEILLKVADALAFAHSRSVIHRDLKPENIMLGEYGEVLVMDWGLALTLPTFAAARSIAATSSMGCTPAYAAPELVRGPRDKIGAHSDVYLLGAILYQIVTGEPPHKGNNVLQCLAAATGNKITPTEQTGELVDIALKAMATEPEDRYQDVKTFQTAVRDYLSHSESLVLSESAAEGLQEAAQSNEYNDYARAVYGFEEALDMWNGNTRAKSGLREAKLAYAKCAQKKGDFDLGMSLLDTSEPAHAKLHTDLKAAKAEVDAREGRLKMARRVGVGLAAAILIVVTAAWYVTAQAREKEEIARKEADQQRQEAVAAKDLAEAATAKEKLAKEAEMTAKDKLAKTNEELEDTNTKLANTNTQLDTANTDLKTTITKLDTANKNLDKTNAVLIETNDKLDKSNTQLEESLVAEKAATDAAVAARNIANAARQQETIQRRNAVIARREQEYESYVANIGLAAERIAANNFEDAREILDNLEKNPPPSGLDWEWHRLKYVVSPRQNAAQAPTMIDAVAYAPDGKHFITGSQDGNARIWSTDNPAAKPVVLPHGGKVDAVAYSRAGAYFATAGDDGLVKIWNAAATPPALLHTRDGHGKQRVTSVVFAPRQNDALTRDPRFNPLPEEWLLTTSFDGTAVLWNAESGEKLTTLRGHDYWVWSAAFSPRGDQLVTVGEDRRAVVWTIKRDKQHDNDWAFEVETKFSGHTIPSKRPNEPPVRVPIYSVAYSHDGQLVATGGQDGQVRIWQPDFVKAPDIKDILRDIKSGASQVSVSAADSQSTSLIGHTSPIYSVNFSSRGMPGKDDSTVVEVLTGSDDNTMKIWNVSYAPAARDKTGQLQVEGELRKTLRGHAGWVRDCAFSPVEGTAEVLSGSHDGQARLWTVNDYAEQFKLEPPEPTVAVNQDDGVLSVAFDHSGRYVVTAGRNQQARIWDARTGRQTHLLGNRDSGNQDVNANALEEGHEYLASIVIPFDDGNRILTSALDNSTRIWDARRGTQLARLNRTGLSAAAAVSPDGEWIATGSNLEGGEFPVKLWNTKEAIESVDDPEPARRLVDHRYRVTALAFSPPGPDGRAEYLLSADSYGRCTLWNLDDDTPVKDVRLNGPKNRVNALLFTPDGKHIIAACDDSYVYVWNWKTNTGNYKSLKHPGDNARVEAIAWIPADGDGLLLSATGGDDRRVRLWDLNHLHTSELGTDVEPVKQYELQGGRRTVAANLRRLMKAGSRPFTVDQLSTKSGISAERIRNIRAADTAADEATLSQLSDALGTPDAELLRPAITGLSISADGKRAYAANSDDGMIDVLNVVPNEDEMVVSTHEGFGAVWSAAVFQMDANGAQPEFKLATIGGNDARIWNLAALQKPAGQPEKELAPHDEVTAVAFSHDGDFIFTVGADASVKVWTLKGGKDIFKFPAKHLKAITHIAFSPLENSNRLLTADEDGMVVIWQWNPQMRTASLVKALPAINGAVHCAVFSPDETRVLTTADNGDARIWTLAEEGKFVELAGYEPNTAVLSGAFSPDGTWVVTGGADQTARLWDAFTGKPYKDLVDPITKEIVMKNSLQASALTGHTDAVTSVAVSPSGSRILTGSRDDTAKLWDPRIPFGPAPPVQAPIPGIPPIVVTEKPAREILTLKGHTDNITSVAFSNDPLTGPVVTGSLDGTAVLWLAKP